SSNGDVYVFFNKSRTTMKLVHWERGGCVVYYKRLERGRVSHKLFVKEGMGFRSLRWDELVLFGRRSEKHLPDNLPGQLSLFDPMHGSPSLPEEKDLLSSLAEEISRKAEQRRIKAKHKAITGKRSYQIPAHIERRETILEPELPPFLVKWWK
ncbi:MAG: transposase, partial [Tannerellaceae bacterium]|nr:transposase [Tannerellaceae bacterium]